MSWFGNLFRTNIASRQKNGSDWFYNRDGGRARYSTMATNRANTKQVLAPKKKVPAKKVISKEAR